MQESPAASGDTSTATLQVASGPQEPFDPCTIPKSAVTASGLDVSTERPDFAGISRYPGWKNCTWDAGGANPWYYLSVMSSMNSIDEYLRSPQNQQRTPVQVGSRAAVRYKADYQGDPPTGCDTVLDVKGNLIILVVDTIGSADTLGDPCAEVATTPAISRHTYRSEWMGAMAYETPGFTDNLTHWQTLRNQASAGELHVESEMARQCDNVCMNYLRDLSRMLEMTSNLSRPEAFGDLPSAQMLGAEFHRLAIGDEGSARFAIKQQIEIVKTMREFFQHCFASVEATDSETAAAVETLSPPR